METRSNRVLVHALSKISSTVVDFNTSICTARLLFQLDHARQSRCRQWALPITFSFDVYPQLRLALFVNLQSGRRTHRYHDHQMN